MFQKQKATCFVLSPLQRLSLGIPVKTAMIKKKASARWTVGRVKRREPHFLSFPSYCPPRAFFLPSPEPPSVTKTPLGGGGGERVFCSNSVKTLSFQGLIHYIIGRQANFAFARVNYAHSSDVQRLLWSSHHHFPLKPSSASER